MIPFFFFYFFFSFLLLSFFFLPLSLVVSPLQNLETHARAEFIHGVNSGFDERRYLFLSKRKRKNFVGLKARNRTWRVDWRESGWMSVRLLERTSFFSYRFRIFRGNIGSARILDRVSSDGIFPVEFFFYLRLSLLSLTFRKFKELHFLDEIEVSRLFK